MEKTKILNGKKVWGGRPISENDQKHQSKKV